MSNLIIILKGRFKMTVGENIRRIRISKGLTQKELADILGVSEANIRAYEKGRRNPKPSSLKKFADALGVNPEVLSNSEFDSITAMHRLFQIFRMYGGNIVTLPDKDDPSSDSVYISFNALILMRSWYQRYMEYQDELSAIQKIKKEADRQRATEAAEAAFNEWMDTYPDSEMDLDLLNIAAEFDKRMDFYGTNPLNNE